MRATGVLLAFVILGPWLPAALAMASESPFADVDAMDALSRSAAMHRAAGDYAAAADVGKRWLDSLPAEYQQSIAITDELERMADDHRKLGRYDEADALFDRELSIYQARLGAHDPIVLVALFRGAVNATLDDRPARAEAISLRALALIDRADGVDPMQRARFLRLAGVAIVDDERVGQAVSMLEEALAIARTLRPGSSDLMMFVQSVADARARAGDFDRALALYDEALSLAELDPTRAGVDREIIAWSVERAKARRREARLGSPPLPARLERDGFVYNSASSLPSQFDRRLARVDRSRVEHAGTVMEFEDLPAHLLATGAQTVLFEGFVDGDELCAGVLLAEAGEFRAYFVDSVGVTRGLIANFTDRAVLHTVWSQCRVRLAPD
jgi:tetratricopeptide (TPR) repeat protein